MGKLTLGSFLSSGTLNGIVVVVLLRVWRAETAPTRASPRGAARAARLNLDPRTRVMAILNYCCFVKGRVPDAEQNCPQTLDSSLFYPFEFISNSAIDLGRQQHLEAGTLAETGLGSKFMGNAPDAALVLCPLLPMPPPGIIYTAHRPRIRSVVLSRAPSVASR